MYLLQRMLYLNTRALLNNSMVAQLVKISPTLMELEDSLLCLQELVKSRLN
jgi:hypothetical protein